jgi:kynureninase
MNYKNTLEFAQQADKDDKLASFRNEFHIPQHNGSDVVYFTGNSLGLQPKRTKQFIEQELNDWSKLGVEGHFLAKHPWFSYHENLTEYAAEIVGAKHSEVVCMNQLTVNIHLLMVSFYRPTKTRYKILCEVKAFPSDQYALETQVKFHGHNPEDAIIEAKPREGELTLRTEDILKLIDENKDSLSLVMMGGVNYYTGQLFEMEKITKHAQQYGIVVGFDLAHAAGNAKLKLHEWNVDFASWCSYKYMNSGPGGVSGVFIHEKHHKSNLNRFAGWWGYDKTTRFKMEKGFKPIETAEGWQLSNAPVLSMAAHFAALEVFHEAGMDNLIAKAEKLTGYLEFIIDEVSSEQPADKKFEIITPRDKTQRGCQISFVAHNRGKNLFTDLLSCGVISDWREPNVIRLAPVPLYNSFEDMYKFGQILKSVV